MIMLNLIIAISTTSVFHLHFYQACRQVVNDVLESPGYPNNYPRSKYCVAFVYTRFGAALNITFEHFDLEYSSNCR